MSESAIDGHLHIARHTMILSRSSATSARAHRLGAAARIRLLSTFRRSSNGLYSPSSSSSAREFNPPPNSPAAFLAELKSFAARGPPGSDVSSRLPLAFSGDARLILSGGRRVVTRDSEFEFSCTSCGNCCRTYPNDVMLDPHDVFLVSRAEGVAQADTKAAHTALHGTTTGLYRLFPKAFQPRLGLFESRAHIVESDADATELARDGGPLSSRHRLAPVLFLRTKKVKQVSKSTGASSVSERCWFSFTSDKTTIEAVDDTATTAAAASLPPRTIKPPSRSEATTAGKGLKCRLGPANMPTPCALYPLGELYHTPAPAPAPTGVASAAPSSQYYTLDTRHCEGTHVPASDATRTTVGGYADRNQLPMRRREWEWFEREIAQPMAARGWLSIDEAEHSSAIEPLRDELRAAIATVWYDFDAMACAPIAPPRTDDAGISSPPIHRFPDWPSARSAIVASTDHIVHATSAFLARTRADATPSVAAAIRQWRADLKHHGVLPREA